MSRKRYTVGYQGPNSGGNPGVMHPFHEAKIRQLEAKYQYEQTVLKNHGLDVHMPAGRADKVLRCGQKRN